MKKLWQLKQNWKIWPCQSRSYKSQGHVKIIQHFNYVISGVLPKYELKPFINENVMTIEAKWKNLTLPVKIISRSRSKQNHPTCQLGHKLFFSKYEFNPPSINKNVMINKAKLKNLPLLVKVISRSSWNHSTCG